MYSTHITTVLCFSGGLIDSLHALHFGALEISSPAASDAGAVRAPYSACSLDYGTSDLVRPPLTPSTYYRSSRGGLTIDLHVLFNSIGACCAPEMEWAIARHTPFAFAIAMLLLIVVATAGPQRSRGRQELR